MKMTVIIPTFHRPDSLMRAIRSLQEQTYMDFEILIADNAADPEVEQLMTEFNATADRRARYIQVPNLGLHNARHAAARAANGGVLVFTDDDASFDPGWLQAYAEAFDEHPAMSAAGGPVRPIWETPPPEWLLEFIGDSRVFSYLSLMEPYKDFRIDPKGFFFGVNMAIRRQVLFDLGGFNPEAFGDSWLGDGETGLNSKLWERGMLIGYVLNAVVYHHIPAQRMTVEYLCHRRANEGACTEYATFHKGMPGSIGIYMRIIRLTTSLVNIGLIILYRLLLKRDQFTLLKARMAFAYQLSRIRYASRLLFDQALRKMVEQEHWLTK
jgi:glucosyl-dolichyl phosphate glucuronosyltransferase